MRKEPCIKPVNIFALEPYIPLLQKYFGLPFEQLELELLAAKHDPEHEHPFEIWEYVSIENIGELLEPYFGDVEIEGDLLILLYLVANLYYEGNVAAHDSAMIEDNFQQIENAQIREEIAQLYSFMQKRKSQPISGDENHIPTKQLRLVAGKEKLDIKDTCCWFEALLENYLFPNCLPDVENDEDAQKLWKREKKAGRPARKEVHAIINGVNNFLKDKGVVDKTVTAPTNLCKFLRDYLEAMGYLENPVDASAINSVSIKTWIHKFEEKEDKPQFADSGLKSPSSFEELEELLKATPDDEAYSWLFHPNRHKS